MQFQEFKVLLLGPTNTGKTTMVGQLIHGSSFRPKRTLGVEVTPLTIFCNQTQFRVNFWDCAGDPRYIGLGPKKYGTGSHLALVFKQNTGDVVQDFVQQVPEGVQWKYVEPGTTSEAFLGIILEMFTDFL